MLSAVLATAILSVFRSVIRRYCGKTIGCRLMLSSLLGIAADDISTIKCIAIFAREVVKQSDSQAGEYGS